MTNAHGRFAWYELMTDEPQAAMSFYAQVAGWTSQDMPMPGMTYTIVLAGQTQVGGMMKLPAQCTGVHPFWSAYIAVDEVDTAAARLKHLGGTVCKEPEDIANVGRYAVVADPQGAMFNIFKSLSPSETAHSMAPGRIAWNELNTNDWAAAFDFYRDMFGWQKGESIDMGAMGTYQLFTIDGTGVGGMFNSPAAHEARFWLFYIGTDDIDAALARISAGGGKVLNGPQEVPGGAWIVQATDPQGAHFAMVGPRK